MKICNEGFDHVEYILKDIKPLAKTFEVLGFEKIGTRHLPERGVESTAYAQGRVRVILSQSLGTEASERDLGVQFLKKQDEGICVLALEVDDAKLAFEETTSRGAKPAMEPRRYETGEGSIVRAEIWSPGNFRYAFIERTAPNGDKEPALLDDGLIVSRLESPAPMGIRRIDHLTNNVGMGEMKTWVEWYDRVFGFGVTRHFDIRTGRTGLISDVVQSEDGKVIVPINEATEKESQVQEFVERMNGSGVQHLALTVDDLLSTLRNLKNSEVNFLQVPHTYYEEVPNRVPNVTENMEELEDLQILLDGDEKGYLLQIFTHEILGPFFFEFIQRKNNNGFGEGNFRALFEAIERDQIRRGVLEA